MIQVGQTIGNYRITAKLGEGGMGVVYLAEHPVIGKKVAMKAIHPELSRNADVVSRFMTEAKAVNQIGNDHIVDISDYGKTPDGEFYFIMEFLQGEALSDRLKRERVLPAMRAIQIAAQVADALAASHAHGIVHRDLKPENVYLIARGSSRDFVKILDFGLAKLTQGDEKVSHKTRTGSVMGTPYYMAPEQCEGKANIDHRADIYSLGVIVFEMLTGKVPFGGEGYGEIIVKHITMQPPSPRSINPALAESLELVVLRALAKARDQRFQTMGDLRTALLDPEGYAAGAPAPPRTTEELALLGAEPAPAPSEPPSSLLGLGPGLAASDGGGSVVPMPSTFRTGIGELFDEVPARRSGKRLWVGLSLLAILAGGGAGAYHVFGSPGAPAPLAAPPSPGAPARPALPLAAAAKPAPTVKVNFTSMPSGARVVRGDTGAQIGVTPLAADLEYSQAAMDFVLKKEGFEDYPLRLIPNISAPYPVVLKPAEAAPASDKLAKKPAHHHARQVKVDEDAVLPPNL